MQIIPKPNKLLIGKNLFTLNKDEIFYTDFYTVGLDFLKLLFDLNGISLKVAKNKDEDAKISFLKVDGLDDEEYSLIINEKGITLSATTEKGCFYGLQSLRLLGDVDTVGKVNSLSFRFIKASDKPRFKYRCFMLDEARHFFGKDVVIRYLNLMALLKLNTFHWHLTDDQGWRIEIKKYPLLTEKGSIRKSTQLSGGDNDNIEYGKGKFYSQEDIKEIVAYAKKLHIEIVPEIDMPGHLISAIACYPELSCEKEDIDVSSRWGVMDTVACVGDTYIYDFAKSVIDELSELFPSPYFHIGGDEVPRTKWKTCETCQALMREKGIKNVDGLQNYFNRQISEYLSIKGKILIGWNEILKGSDLKASTVVQWWMGDRYHNGVIEWLNKGNKVIISQNDCLYADYPYARLSLRKYYNVFKTLELDKGFEKCILGVDSPLWTEYVDNETKAFFNTLPRLLALAEICWTEEKNKSYSDFQKRLSAFFKLLDVYNIPYASPYYYKGRRSLTRPNWTSCANKEFDDYLK